MLHFRPRSTKWDEILGTRMSAEQAAKMYARRAAAKAEALVNAVESTVEEKIIQPVQENVVEPALEAVHEVTARLGREDDEVSLDSASTTTSAAGTPVEEIDSGIELEETKGKTSGVQLNKNGAGVQTRARARTTRT